MCLNDNQRSDIVWTYLFLFSFLTVGLGVGFYCPNFCVGLLI